LTSFPSEALKEMRGRSRDVVTAFWVVPELSRAVRPSALLLPKKGMVKARVFELSRVAALSEKLQIQGCVLRVVGVRSLMRGELWVREAFI
jgi:hypothetical protein